MMDAHKLTKLRIDKGEAPVAPSRGRRKAFLLVLLLSVVAACSLIAFQHGLFTPAASVHVTSAAWIHTSQTLTDFNASGYVVAQRKAAVASKGTGRLEVLTVKEGSRVKEGDVLARLENEDLKAEQAQIEAQMAAARADLARFETELRTAERNFKRYSNLWERQLVSRLEFENTQDLFSKSKSSVESGRASIKALEFNFKRLGVLIGYTVIRAPFDGVVLTKDADVGEVVAPFGSATSAKAAVVTMADLKSLMVQTDVAESFLSKVREEQPCEIQLDAVPETRFSGRVSTIVPTADRTRGTVMVKVRFDCLDARILPEMSARVAFLSRPLTHDENTPFLGVHRDALTQQEGTPGVFKLDAGQAVWMPLPSSRFMGDYLILSPPAQPGDPIILKPAAGIRAGDKVKVAE